MYLILRSIFYKENVKYNNKVNVSTLLRSN
jgi:hypothetical protein